MRLSFLLSLLICIGVTSLQAQKKITVSVTNVSFSEFIKELEKQTSFQFYYNPKWTDSLTVTVSATEVDLSALLTDVLRPTELSFAIDLSDHVFITRSRILLTSLPNGLIARRNSQTGDDNFDASSFDKKVKKIKQVEPKTYVLGSKSAGLSGNATISGFVRDQITGEPLPGVAVFVPEPLIGVSTDALGKYSLILPKGKRAITIQSVGMKTVQLSVMLYDNGKLDVDLEEDITALKEVVVNADHEIAVTGLLMGREKLDIRTMRQMPLALGETDVMKVVLTLPGVQTVGEGTNGLNVRGGATNQNLILFNGATVYNPSHLFGFFSTFNPDVLKSIELYKSGLEADAGGRLSSLLDVTTREGNLKKFTATGGISPITGRLTLEGPIIKGKTSFLLAGRSTYSDWILRQLQTKQFSNSTAAFYDLNFVVGHKIDDNNHLTLSAYRSKDRFKLNTDTVYSYSDQNASVKWTHRFNPKLFGDLLVTASNYQFSISSNANPINAFNLAYSIRQYQAKMDFNYILNKQHTFHAGLSSILYRLSPGSYVPNSAESVVTPDVIEQEKGLENAIYIGDNLELNPKLSFYVGVRYSLFSYLGPRDVFQYKSQLPIEQSNITDTVRFGRGAIKSYHGPEPRITSRYLINKNTSLKFSYGRTRQYIQMLSNNTAIAPTDIYKLSDQYIKPQIADQISAGWFRNWSGGAFEFSSELYYKYISQATDFQNGAKLIRNHHLETDVLNAKGKSYGAEFMIRKSAGRLNGWVSYTYSRSFLKTQSQFEIERVNNGNYYRSNFDKPHAVNLISNYKFSRRINISLNATYSTGRPITLPFAKFDLAGSDRLEYSFRNGFRVPYYFRSDFSINVEGNHKIKKLAHSSWTFAIYNLTARRNAYSIFFRSEGGEVKGYKLSIFGQAIPTITYNFRM